MKSALLSLLALAALALLPSQAHAGDNVLTLERYLYNEDGEIVLTSVSALAYTEACLAYSEGNKGYRHGRGLKANWPAAFMNFEIAARSGHAEALFYLGRMYFFGHGVERDYDQAYHYYQLAARNGSCRAYNNLGFMESGGYGRPENPQQAFEYFQCASDMGMAMGSYNLARIYHRGEPGIPKDMDKAFQYLRLALIQLDSLYGDVAEDFARWALYESDSQDPVMIEHALRMLELLEANGQPWAAYVLGNYYAREEDDFSQQKAYEHYLAAANGGIVDAMIKVGHRLYDGNGVEKDRMTSYVWYRTALAKDPENKYAIYMMGAFNYSGDVVNQDYEAALKYFRQALELGNYYAGEYLGNMYQEGQGCDKDPYQAFLYYDLCGDDISAAAEWKRGKLAQQLTPEQRKQAYEEKLAFQREYWSKEQG